MTEFEERLGMEFVRECFVLKGDALYWADRPVRHFADEYAHRVFHSKYVGKSAGRRESSGYITINLRVDGVRLQLQAHRVIWMLHKGQWPLNVIDHENRVRSDNRIVNLRDVTTAVNNQNCARRAVLPGAYPFRGKYQSSVRVGRESIHLGLYGTAEEANTHYEEVNAALAEVARSLAKKSPVGRPRLISDQTFPDQTPWKRGSE